MKAKTIEEFFGTLQQSTVEAWKEHLKTDKYSAHKALNEFYEEIVELVDGLIEDYMGLYGKVKDYKNLMSTDKMSAVDYLEELKDLVKSSRDDLFKEEDTEIFSDLDEILSLIDSTLYKLKELKEDKNFKGISQFIKEHIVSESLGTHVNERKIYKNLYDALEEHLTQALIETWDDTRIEFTQAELKQALEKLAKNYNIDDHIDWAKDIIK